MFKIRPIWIVFFFVLIIHPLIAGNIVETIGEGDNQIPLNSFLSNP